MVYLQKYQPHPTETLFNLLKTSLAILMPWNLSKPRNQLGEKILEDIFTDFVRFRRKFSEIRHFPTYNNGHTDDRDADEN